MNRYCDICGAKTESYGQPLSVTAEFKGWNRERVGYVQDLCHGCSKIVRDAVTATAILLAEPHQERLEKRRAEQDTARKKRTERMGSTLYGADPNCDHDIRPAPGGGVKCWRCPGWYCA